MTAAMSRKTPRVRWKLCSVDQSLVEPLEDLGVDGISGSDALLVVRFGAFREGTPGWFVR